jgi:succinate dehydrogenase/fumarate reductase flavoprotein subunit
MAESDRPGREHDVVVIGSGAAGLTAAVVAASKGLSVIVLEKAKQFGGTTALSGGAAWIPNNHLMGSVGQEDSEEEGLEYMRAILGNGYDEKWARTYVRSGPQMLRALEAISEVRFYPLLLPDYSPSTASAKRARSVVALEYDGRRLGRRIGQVRNPLPGFAAFKSFQTDPQHVAKLTSVFKNASGFWFTAKRMAAFARDLVIYGKGTHMANGNALVGRLLKSAIDLGVTLHTSAPLNDLFFEDGRVAGVFAHVNGRRVKIGARKAVVLATGGFGANAEMRRKFMPQGEYHLSAQPLENVGDGIRIGQASGAHMAPPNNANGVWAPCSAHRDDRRNIVSIYPHFGPDRAKPGVIIVDSEGRRFANEAAPYQDFVNIMNDRKIHTAWFIGDHVALRSYGMGIAMAAPLPYKHLIRDGYLIKAASIAELAESIDVPAATLQETVNRFNKHAETGVDPDFGKGSNIYDNALGDFSLSPNPNLRGVTHGPFYAIKLHPGDCSSVLGLETSIDSEVLNSNGAPIPGLFAVGLDQNSLMKGTYPGGGSSIGPAMTFAYRAALKIAEEEDLTNA